ncbi:uncharacterized protein KGF55_002474 [Candida pseudojiufengensis]|uniref:uncharacterized protein n=1 Tax=Candida pseudojiufengensis TaxID=497109 RepID=UPI0022247449|nr:uncharacterized protein KGF55_002474 [Candida pseudojiufengensis]KAI5963594.1 hypothetical protein KGF55_002474 [Candida pseudojiufengensis]
MKVITDKDVLNFLNQQLSQSSLLSQFQPTLISGLKTYSSNPNEIVPPRTSKVSKNPNSDTTHIFMPCVSPNEVGIKVISGGSGNNKKGLGFLGCVLILDEITGELQAVLNANTLTAFRTALASTLGLTKVINVNDENILPEISVFGVGLQAYWHVKLALVLYEGFIKTVNILNRTLSNAEKLRDQFTKEFKNIKFNAFSYQENEESFIEHLRNSSIIFGCTPSTSPIIKKDYLNQDPKHPVFISLIGSYKPNMIELDLKLLKDLKSKGIKIIVDSKEHTLHEAGELIQSGYQEELLIELHELYGDESKQIVGEVTDKSSNITIQKIVGLSIMDLSIGKLVYENIGDEAVIVNDF